MQRDCGDILDKLSIAKLKKERVGTEESIKEFEAFSKGFSEEQEKYPMYDWNQLFEMMYSINDFIWQLEAGLKSGKETLSNPHYILDKSNDEALTRIGTTTILIRNFNFLRVQFKNIINKLVKEGFQDAKKDHISSFHL